MLQMVIRDHIDKYAKTAIYNLLNDLKKQEIMNKIIMEIDMNKPFINQQEVQLKDISPNSKKKRDASMQSKF